MPYYKDYRTINDSCNVVLNHIWKLLDQCYSAAAECTNQTVEIADLILSLRILVFHIKVRQNIIMKFRDWPVKHRKKLDRHMLRFEKLQLDFQDTKSKKDVQSLRRQKMQSFCAHVRLSFNEIKFLLDLYPKSFYFSSYHKQLIKCRKKMFDLLLNKNNCNWTLSYLRRVKKFKNIANIISQSINSYHHFRYTHEHERTIEDLGLTE